MTHVTASTARRLKAAGFPQPAFATGQIWYNKYGEASFVGRRDVFEKSGQETFFCTSVRSGRTEEITPVHEGAFFAPTAEDILRELSPDKIQGSVQVVYMGDRFQVAVNTPDLYDFFVDASLSEALATAWLAIHEKPA